LVDDGGVLSKDDSLLSRVNEVRIAELAECERHVEQDVVRRLEVLERKVELLDGVVVEHVAIQTSWLRNFAPVVLCVVSAVASWVLPLFFH
jgi:hypothetical protein